MSRFLSAPRCHWPPCRRTMFLLNESADYWFFQCECGTSRALTKPSARAQSQYTVRQNDLEQERARRKWLESRPAYSIPKGASR